MYQNMPGGNAGVCQSETSLERWYQFKQPTPTLQPNIGITTQRFKFEFLPQCALKQGA